MHPMMLGCLCGCFGNNSIIGTWSTIRWVPPMNLRGFEVIITLAARTRQRNVSAGQGHQHACADACEQRRTVRRIRGNTLRITSPDSGAVITMTRVR
jgi:hypothetical protein